MENVIEYLVEEFLNIDEIEDSTENLRALEGILLILMNTLNKCLEFNCSLNLFSNKVKSDLFYYLVKVLYILSNKT